MTNGNSIAWAEEFLARFKDAPTKYLARVRLRLMAGHKEYGDASHSKTRLQLIDEIQQEAEDICGWAGILWLQCDEEEREDLEFVCTVASEMWSFLEDLRDGL